MSDDNKPDPQLELEESRMPLWMHLDELRKVMFRCCLAVALGVCVTYYFSDRIVLFLEKPILQVLPQNDAHLYFTGITDKFFTYLKVSIYTAIALVSPYLLYQVWSFVSPALYRHERRFVAPFLILATFFFTLGLTFAYTIIIPYGYKFLLQFGSSTDKPIITLNEYFGLTTQLMMAMGLVFELPVILMLLAKFGIIKDDVLTRKRGHAYVALAVVAAVITPTPDAFTMILVLIPLCLLYEVSVILVRWVMATNPKPQSTA